MTSKTALYPRPGVASSVMAGAVDGVDFIEALAQRGMQPADGGRELLPVRADEMQWRGFARLTGK
ncbi:MAG TPA: hypothetical protein VK519_01645 [Pinirhizobacter sp.]|nr:hypothetical protein [Pinirhizobacter sp.]